MAEYLARWWEKFLRIKILVSVRYESKLLNEHGGCVILRCEPGQIHDHTLTISYEKYKGKFHPITGHEGLQGEQMYSSTLPSTSAIDGWSMPRPCFFIPGKDPVLIV